MNDDEVKQWLSVEERRMLLQTDKPYVLTLARALAETRKALAACEWGGSEYAIHCNACGAHPAKSERATHKPGCIFTTMPRPQE